MKDKFASIYEPYIRLNGKWDYALYLTICNELGVTPDLLITTFTDRIGFLVAAAQMYPDINPSDACFEYSKYSMKYFAEMQAAKVQPSSPATMDIIANSNNSDVTIKTPCCGGGQVR